MSVKCQYPVSGQRENGTLRLCSAPVTHYFDFAGQPRVVCASCSTDPRGLYPRVAVYLIGEKPSMTIGKDSK